ncbi:MAG: SDR family NAD(P)-dependent oxidoreductase [Candidatus Cryptobacteroides sp.]
MEQVQGQNIVPSGWFIVTGASGSVGCEVVKGLAGRGYSVILACRSLERGRKAMADVLKEVPAARLRVELLDVSSPVSINDFVSRVSDLEIAGILNNAGAIFRDYALTPEGRERTFAVNYFGPKELTEALLPLLRPGSIVVNTISITAFISRLCDADLQPDASRFGQLRTYGKAKLALLRYTRELAEKRPDLIVNATDPGVVNSNMITMGRWFDPIADVIFRPFCKSPAKGAIPAINAITSGLSGRYFSGNGSRAL